MFYIQIWLTETPPSFLLFNIQVGHEFPKDAVPLTDNAPTFFLAFYSLPKQLGGIIQIMN